METLFGFLILIPVLSLPILWLIGVALAFRRPAKAHAVLRVVILVAIGTPLPFVAMIWAQRQFTPPFVEPEAALGGAVLIILSVLEAIVFGISGALVMWFLHWRRRSSRL